MENVRITENGIEIPLPGQMKVSVEMSENMLCEFMQYRKGLEENAELKNKIKSLQNTLYNAEKELDRITEREKKKQARTIKKIEQAFGFALFKWQKDFIFDGVPYGEEIRFARRVGKTFAHCLRVCLSEGEPIRIKKHSPKHENHELYCLAGEDGSTIPRMNFFLHDLCHTYEMLKEAGGIELREIEF